MTRGCRPERPRHRNLRIGGQARHRLPCALLRPGRSPLQGADLVPHQAGSPVVVVAASGRDHPEGMDAARGQRAAAAQADTSTDYADTWLEQRDLKDRTREHYRKLLDDHITPNSGHCRSHRSPPTTSGRGTPSSARTRHRRCEHTLTGCCGPSWAPRPATARSPATLRHPRRRQRQARAQDPPGVT